MALASMVFSGRRASPITRRSCRGLATSHWRESSKIQHKVCYRGIPNRMITAHQPPTNLPSGRYGEKCALSSMSCCLVCDIFPQRGSTDNTLSLRLPAIGLGAGGSLSRRQVRCAEMLVFRGHPVDFWLYRDGFDSKWIAG